MTVTTTSLILFSGRDSVPDSRGLCGGQVALVKNTAAPSERKTTGATILLLLICFLVLS